ncbi:MAG: hypothetical protein CM15mP6_0930 [Methanobacteriota archaeon]|nr:MAG: hypothetical protein CM15mP6_0930 [Euryarchaeota archaeon]
MTALPPRCTKGKCKSLGFPDTPPFVGRRRPKGQAGKCPGQRVPARDAPRRCRPVASSAPSVVRAGVPPTSPVLAMVLTTGSAIVWGETPRKRLGAPHDRASPPSPAFTPSTVLLVQFEAPGCRPEGSTPLGVVVFRPCRGAAEYVREPPVYPQQLPPGDISAQDGARISGPPTRPEPGVRR